MTFTTNQWAILVLVLILGWVLGLASRSGSGRWRRLAEEERVRRETAEERIPALNARISELERREVAAPAAIAPAALREPEVVREPVIVREPVAVTPTENLDPEAGRPNPPVV